MPSPANADSMKTRDPAQLPHLIRLLDDASPAIRGRVLEGLKRYGMELDDELQRQRLVLTPEQRVLVRSLLGDTWAAGFLRAWVECFTHGDDASQVESAHALLADYQLGEDYPVKLSRALDSLAGEFKRSGSTLDALGLNRFLFISKRLRGADDDYYNPLNSNLLHVMQTAQGIPISLVSLFILVGKRVGLEIQGCNFPNHFLARATVAGVEHLFDPFSGGRVLTPEDLGAFLQVAPRGLSSVLRTPATAPVLMGRVLRNLIVAYRRAEQAEHAEFLRRVLNETQSFQRRTGGAQSG